MTEHAMLDRVVLRATGRIVSHRVNGMSNCGTVDSPLVLVHTISMNTIVMLAIATFAQVDARSVVVDHVTALEINRVVSEFDGSEVFSMLVVWRGKEIVYAHFWGECGPGSQFGHVLADDPNNAQIFIHSLDGPRLLVAPALKRSTTFESVELQHALNSPNGRNRKGLTPRRD